MDIRTLLSSIRQKAASGRGRAILTFVIFLIISTIFWFMMTLNETVQRDYRLAVRITGLPTGTKFITTPPQYIDVSVKDKGRALVKFDWGTPPTVEVRYGDFIKKGENRIVINQEMLSNNIRNSFGSGCEILSIRPDSINLITTSRPGDRLPVFLDITVATEPQFVSYGAMKCDYDSVTVYSLNGIPSNTLNVRTEPVTLRNLKDSTTIKVTLLSPEGTRVEPSEISVTIPVEPLVAKKRIIPITTVNTPRNITLHTFPSSVELNYLVPMSMFKNDEASPTATVDFDKIDRDQTTAPVTIGQIPEYYRNSTPVPAEVEYLIENSSSSGIYSLDNDKAND